MVGFMLCYGGIAEPFELRLDFVRSRGSFDAMSDPEIEACWWIRYVCGILSSCAYSMIFLPDSVFLLLLSTLWLCLLKPPIGCMVSMDGDKIVLVIFRVFALWFEPFGYKFMFILGTILPATLLVSVPLCKFSATCSYVFSSMPLNISRSSGVAAISNGSTSGSPFESCTD